MLIHINCLAHDQCLTYVDYCRYYFNYRSLELRLWHDLDLGSNVRSPVYLPSLCLGSLMRKMGLITIAPNLTGKLYGLNEIM